MDTLARWSAEARVDEAARSRSRERWLRRQAEEESTFHGVLADLADRGRSLLFHGVAGRRHRGVIVAMGQDFVAVSTDQGHQVLLTIRGIRSLRPQARESEVMSGRSLSLDYGFAEAVAALAEDRPRVLVVTAEVEGAFSGELRSVGQDVISLRLDGDTRSNSYIPLDAVMELLVS